MAERERISILGGISIEVAIPSRDSNYACCVCIETDPPGGGPPPHMHLREEEVFTPLEGDYEFLDPSGAWTRLAVGVPLLSPRGTFHAFRNAGDRKGRMMFMTNAGGIDDYFRAIAGLRVPEDLARVEEISRFYGYVFQPPAG